MDIQQPTRIENLYLGKTGHPFAQTSPVTASIRRSGAVIVHEQNANAAQRLFTDVFIKSVGHLQKIVYETTSYNIKNRQPSYMDKLAVAVSTSRMQLNDENHKFNLVKGEPQDIHHYLGACMHSFNAAVPGVTLKAPTPVAKEDINIFFGEPVSLKQNPPVKHKKQAHFQVMNVQATHSLESGELAKASKLSHRATLHMPSLPVEQAIEHELYKTLVYKGIPAVQLPVSIPNKEALLKFPGAFGALRELYKTHVAK
jgi:hypothetical protein